MLVVLLVLAVALIGFDYRDGSSALLRHAKDAAGSAFGAVERAASSVGQFFTGSRSSTSGQVAALRREVIRLRAELSQAKLSKTDYAQLRRLLQLSGQGRYKIVAASVIAYGQGYQHTVTIDVGSQDGVRPDETVMNGQGLVGQVTSVTGGTATVLLATDPSSVVGIELAPKGEVGWVTGTGVPGGAGGQLRLQVLNSSLVLRVGEQLVTSASRNDRPFVPGVPVGTISKVLNRSGSLTGIALVKPFADFTALGIVGVVIAPPAHNPRFSVLPPVPKPGPTVTVTVTPSPTAKTPKKGH